jgi:hypothetical protein
MIVVGIDPGLAGAVASLDAGGRLRHLHDTLAMAIRVGRQTLQDDDLQAMRRRPVPYAGASCHVCIEPQQAIPGQGVISLFKLGMGYGLWMALIATLQLPNTPGPSPLAGKRSVGLLGRDKDASWQRVHQLFPTADLARKNDHGRGEAFASRTPASATPSRDGVAPRGSAAGSRLEAVRVVLGCSEWDQRRALSCFIVHGAFAILIVHGASLRPSDRCAFA